MSSAVAFRIAPVRNGDDLLAARRLIEAYVASLGIDLGFQDFDAELAALPGAYAPPRGELLLARGSGGEPLGCVALRPLGSDGRCEMKRLFVAPAGRGLGVGRALIAAIVEVAAGCGYREMLLDTLPGMHAALALYRQAGFVDVPQYYASPLATAVYLRLALAGSTGPSSESPSKVAHDTV